MYNCNFWPVTTTCNWLYARTASTNIKPTLQHKFCHWILTENFITDRIFLDSRCQKKLSPEVSLDLKPEGSENLQSRFQKALLCVCACVCAAQKWSPFSLPFSSIFTRAKRSSRRPFWLAVRMSMLEVPGAQATSTHGFIYDTHGESHSRNEIISARSSLSPRGDGQPLFVFYSQKIILEH